MADVVKITLEVISFRAIGDFSNPGRFVEIKDPTITEDLGTRAFFYPGDLRTIRLNNGNNGNAGAKPVDLDITIVGPGGANLYIVAGVLINNQGLDQTHAKGSNFDTNLPNKNLVRLKDKYKRGKEYWEVYIAIQDSTGRIGIVDPGVENSDLD